MEQITSKENGRIKELAKLMRSKKYRQERSAFVTEGLRLSLDALSLPVAIEEVYVTEEVIKKHPKETKQLLEHAGHAAIITPEIAEKIGDTQTTQGVFCVLPMLDNSAQAVRIRCGGRYIVGVSLQDPGNIGTIVRTAEAFGLDGVVLSSDCPDLYSPKVLRATMGGVFRIPIYLCDKIEGFIQLCQGLRLPVYATALKEDSVPVTMVDLPSGAAVLIGNEGNGLSDELIEQCDQSIIIPMQGNAQSLNAAMAAGIIIWEMSRAQ